MRGGGGRYSKHESTNFQTLNMESTFGFNDLLSNANGVQEAVDTDVS